MTSLLVRRALPEDLEEIMALLAQDSMHYYEEPAAVSANQRAAFDEIDTDVNQDLLVGELDGQIVCTAQVTWMRMLAADGGLYCQVEAVRTDSAMRGHGIGALLMESIEGEARRRGAARIQLTSNKERTRAHTFYERLGYVASHVGMKKYL
ncbi:GNAT family N-acetyltransferase [Aeromicrobium panaciterrae]|uniref:GNAT family N-acetyltransferase n=1 Tax=Aeromicrobium panaciterrae TaxID=363861 RepID=UPI0031D65991